MTEEQKTRDDDFDLQLTIAIEEQMEAEQHLFEPPYDLFVGESLSDLLSEPLQSDEMSPEEYEEIKITNNGQDK